MQEIALSDNLAQIELEINHHKQLAGQSIWEIGRRLNHVKEHDLVHGQFMEWYQNLGIDKDFASKSMKIAKELPNFETLRNLGTTALHLIATLPEENRQEQIERIEQGDSPTVRELQEVKRQLNLARSANDSLREQNERLAEQALKGLETKTIEKEIVKEIEVAPADYDATKSLNATLLEKNSQLKREYEDLNSRAEFIEQQYNKLVEERKAVDEKSAKYDELTEAIKQSQGQLSEAQAKIGSYKSLLSFIRKGNEMVVNMGGLVYVDEQRILHSDSKVRNEFEQLQKAISRLAEDMGSMLKETEVLEGEII
jgi:chromosome segregation ATPase